MSDPKRWIQDGEGAPQGARELLLAASRPRPMTSAELARTAARVAPLGTTAGAGTTLPTWVKGLFLAVGLGLGGAGLYATLDGGPGGADSTAAPLVLTDLPLEELLSRSQGGVPVAAPAQAAPAPLFGAAPEVEAPRPVAPPARRDPPRSTRPAAPAPAAPVDSDELLRESNLIDRARAAATQNPEAALSAVGEHQREFPAGRLAEEREYVAIRALMRLGRVDEARARADAFLARYPSTSYADRVHRAVGAAP
ncbi:hypothetical protein WME99_01100 [Sorangium sp. So ce136]|uniref:hypothetical protein n=1 Tax=Sorangium sp. So ce136 TaxID=3133284 RepID=UPI003F037E6D